MSQTCLDVCNLKVAGFTGRIQWKWNNSACPSFITNAGVPLGKAFSTKMLQWRCSASTGRTVVALDSLIKRDLILKTFDFCLVLLVPSTINHHDPELIHIQPMLLSRWARLNLGFNVLPNDTSISTYGLVRVRDRTTNLPIRRWPALRLSHSCHLVLVDSEALDAFSWSICDHRDATLSPKRWSSAIQCNCNCGILHLSWQKH